MIKIDKRTARKMYNSGHSIILVPCKCNVGNNIAYSRINLIESHGKDFDILVNTFEYFNCNSELGHYSHYYVCEIDMQSYNSCLLMCN